MNFILPYLAIIVQTFPLIIGLSVYRRLDKVWRILVSYFALMNLFQFIQLSQMQSGNSLWVAHLGVIFQYAFLMIVFSFWFNRVMVRKILLWSIPLYSVVCIANSLFIQNITTFNSYSLMLESIIFSLVSASLSFRISQEIKSSLARDSRFWVSTATLMYFAGTLLLHGFSNILVSLPTEMVYYAFLIQVVLSIVANLLYSGGLFWEYRAQKYGGR